LIISNRVHASGMHAASLGKKCPNCDSGALRPSRMRAGDATLLMTLRLPLRCQYWGKRSYSFLWRVAAIQQAYHAPSNQRKGAPFI
jgi:hypothetical protein